MKPINENLMARIEALLFLYGGAGVKKDLLIETLPENKPSTIDEALINLTNYYQDTLHSGLMVQRFNQDYYRLCTKPELAQELEKLNLVPTEIHLSPTMIEVATIIAYKGPMTRSELEKFRGSDSSFILNKLRDLNLVSHNGHKSESRAHLYDVTNEFFKVFNLPEGRDSLLPLSPSDLEVRVNKTNLEENKFLFE